MTSPEIIAFLSDITVILDYHEKMGTSKNPFIVAEFTHWHAELLKQLEKEHETRNRNVSPRRPEAGTDLSRDQPRSGLTAREPRREQGGD